MRMTENSQYDSLGQVTSGKKYWSDGTPVLGQQFEYVFDDIGNRKTAVTGGDQWGANKRYQSYTANLLNQYLQRTVPGYVELLGAATNAATVTVNILAASRQGEYFRVEVPVNNSTGAVWLALTNLAVLPQGANPDLVATNLGNLFIPRTPEVFGHDADGNLTNDGRWLLTWDGENRLMSMEGLPAAPEGSKRRLTFKYDPQGRRIQKAVQSWTNSAWNIVLSNRFVYDGWNLIAELNATNNALIRSYVWGLDLSGSQQGAGGVGGVLGVITAGVCHFAAFDGNGSVAALLDGVAAAISAQYQYGPLGEVLRATGPMARANPFRFLTKYQDDESDALYSGGCYYNAYIGCWLCRFPATDERGQNLYSLRSGAFISGTDGADLTPPVLQAILTSKEDGDCGSFKYTVFLRLQYPTPDGPRPGGFIVQDVNAHFNISNCAGQPIKLPQPPPSNLTFDPNWWPFYEAWQVDPGQNAPSPSPGKLDIWRFGSVPCSTGTIDIDANLEFYSGQPIPPYFGSSGMFWFFLIGGSGASERRDEGGGSIKDGKQAGRRLGEAWALVGEG